MILKKPNRHSIACLPLFRAEEDKPQTIGAYEIFHVDAFDWLEQSRARSIHAVVTDPPYGLVEYRPEELEKMKNGRGGVWRIPPSFDGCRRRPLPRFTVLRESDKEDLRFFFTKFAERLLPVLVPGGHVFIATNPLVSYLVYEPFIRAGFEKRGEIIRVIYTLRGGDRPKNAHHEFPDVSVMPKSCWEPWGLFRKPCEGRVQDNLRKWGTGGLRRISEEEPFKDLIYSSPARGREREMAPHPSLKPQHFLRQLVRASLPLGKGVLLDPFMGSGSTIAAAAACGLKSIGLEMNREYFEMAQKAIPQLAAYTPKDMNGDSKYEGSKAGAGGGGRTHTFGLRHPALKFKGKAVYERSDVRISGGKAVPRNGG
jgi:site-specific DNA-methyltransferase (adenine-specific)